MISLTIGQRAQVHDHEQIYSQQTDAAKLTIAHKKQGRAV